MFVMILMDIILCADCKTRIGSGMIEKSSGSTSDHPRRVGKNHLGLRTVHHWSEVVRSAKWTTFPTEIRGCYPTTKRRLITSWNEEGVRSIFAFGICA